MKNKKGNMPICFPSGPKEKKIHLVRKRKIHKRMNHGNLTFYTSSNIEQEMGERMNLDSTVAECIGDEKRASFDGQNLSGDRKR